MRSLGVATSALLVCVGSVLLIATSPWVSTASRNPRCGDRGPDGAPINKVIGALVGLATLVYGVVGLLS